MTVGTRPKIMPSESFRYELARFLVVVSFVWPFLNLNHFFPDSSVEINFVFVFVAMGLAPVLLFENSWSTLLAVAVIAVASLWGPASSSLRLLVGIAPCLFLVGLYRHFHDRGKELIPRGIAYKALLLFVGFSVLQHIDFNILPVVPGWLTNFLTILVPRYNDIPYDESGIRGVQGWASEPSGAAMTCFSFCIVALRQEPEKRQHILLLFTVLALVNKSVYCMFFLVLLALACLWHVRNRLLAVSAVAVFALTFSYFALQTSRATELRENVDMYGLDQESNHELFRFAQILHPLGSFPKLYSPASVFGLDIQPLGLLPLLVGYGSAFGVFLYYRVIFLSFPLSQAGSKPLALVTILLLSFLSPPDFIPAIVAFTYAMAPIKGVEAAPGHISAQGGLARMGPC